MADSGPPHLRLTLRACAGSASSGSLMHTSMSFARVLAQLASRALGVTRIRNQPSRAM